MRFIEALQVLSKSSSYAVSTENKYKDPDSYLDKLKMDLYVKMPIEDEINSAINAIKSGDNKVVFLCGSSGDGKSELLARAKGRAPSYVHFHLDATHSFDPHENAIQTLDRLFDKFEADASSLVVGINVGMLGNYAQEGNNQRFKDAINRYQRNKEQIADFKFINFEDFPKFEITKDGYQATFAKRILAQITSPSALLYQVYKKELTKVQDPESRRVTANYALMSSPNVQETIIELLLKARLVRDQFLTARALLDFIYQLLAGPGYLFDNLFAGGDNELAEKIADFDPALLRTKAIDRFMMAFDLQLDDPNFVDFEKDLREQYGLSTLASAKSYVRFFYTLKNQNISNDFHQQFSLDFQERLLHDFLGVYRLHRFFEGDPTAREELKRFYGKKLVPALRNYINRNAPQLSNKQFLISQFDDFQMAAHLDVKPHYTNLKVGQLNNPSMVTARLKVGVDELDFSMNINLFDLIERLNAGYRPSKNDRSAVILLNEIANRISAIARQSGELLVSSNTQEFKFSLDDDYIEVEEL